VGDTWYVAHMGKMRKTYKLTFRKPERRPFG
jgi:hypothetical protein